MALYFPLSPAEGQKYVGINGITYTWLSNRWSGTHALEQGQAEFYIDNRDALWQYDPDLHNELDGGIA